MATATFAPTIDGTDLFGTSADDTITLDMSGATGSFAVNTRAGSDTVVFDGILATSGAARGVYNFGSGAFTDGLAIVTPTAFETLTFENGTITSAASVTPEQLLATSISGEIGDLGDDVSSPTDGASTVDGMDDFDLSTVLDWNGTAVTANAAAWTIQSINGVASSSNANISIVDGGVIQGRVSVNGTNDGINVTAENAFHTAINEIGGKQTISFDVVLDDGAGNTFSETLSVDVLGVASDANNTFVGTAAAETVDGLGGNDTMSGGDGADTLFGNDGDDRIFAGAGDTGADMFVGGDGDDILGGGAGNDVLVGNEHIGVDTFGANTDDGSNTIFGGEGDDAIAIGGYDNAVMNFTLTSGAIAADFTGTMGGTAFGGAGEDQIWGSASGDDIIGGGADDDTINTLDGDNIVYAGAGDDSVTGGAGDSTIFGGAGDDNITGGAGDELIFNGDGTDVVVGGAGNDTIYGSGGDDNLTGGADADVFAFVEGNGNDVVADFADGEDMIDFSALTGVTSINDLVVTDDGADLIIYYGSDDTVTLTNQGGNLGTTITDADFMFA